MSLNSRTASRDAMTNRKCATSSTLHMELKRASFCSMRLYRRTSLCHPQIRLRLSLLPDMFNFVWCLGPVINFMADAAFAI